MKEAQKTHPNQSASLRPLRLFLYKLLTNCSDSRMKGKLFLKYRKNRGQYCNVSDFPANTYPPVERYLEHCLIIRTLHVECGQIFSVSNLMFLMRTFLMRNEL